MRDVFLCHAGEDKDDVVRPLAEAFNESGISCWYDEAEIQWGDSITQKVNEGLKLSTYVIVILSPAFVDKNWPKRELNSVLNIEASTGNVRVLPLLVGDEASKRQLLKEFPLLNDKMYLPWGGEVRSIVEAMLKRLGKDEHSEESGSYPQKPDPGYRIPLPKIKKKFTQRDKDLFLRNSFLVIKEYFQHALNAIGKQYNEIETDYAEVTNFNFVSTIYINGEVGNKCKIWIGGMTSSDSIAYHTGDFRLNNDGSYSDMLSIENDDERLGLRPWNIAFGSSNQNRDNLLSAEQAAEYLWKEFTANIQ